MADSRGGCSRVFVGVRGDGTADGPQKLAKRTAIGRTDRDVRMSVIKADDAVLPVKHKCAHRPSAGRLWVWKVGLDIRSGKGRFPGWLLVPRRGIPTNL
jgi:hypothetical protein